MEREGGQERRKFTREFKLEAVRLIQGTRVSYMQRAQMGVLSIREAVCATAVKAWRISANEFPGRVR